ncbi:hypothetical protein QR680_016312 [Steinernema hermaphroditum]|uniref:CRAL-TRIO domain-containing protein n=1 Tax=Steinernema hermaphroditum TaxID=289476 RepID=A0AA39LMD0_9BILA|nr:hypothetical protein QR680_016312 [Steinernema hermaphroditum]
MHRIRPLIEEYVASKRKGHCVPAHIIAMSHYITAKEITSEMRAKIDELKEKCAPELERYPEYNTDFALLRWLMGWDYDVDVIVPKLKFCLSTLHALEMHKKDYATIEQIYEYGKSQSAASEYFPGGLMGYDKDGNVIAVQCIAKAHPKSLSSAGRVSELLRLNIMEAEAAFKLVRRKETEGGKKLGIKLIVDLDGFSMDLLYTPTLKIYLNLISHLQSMFPDFARSIFVINCPAMISLAYSAVQPVLSKQTREKVQFLGADWKEKLADDLGIENIWPHWGGTKPLPDIANGKVTGLIRMGGKVPLELRYENNNNEVKDKSLTKLNVGARSSKKIQVEVSSPGSTLSWFFKCSSGDIEFSIKKDGLYVWPRFRIVTDFVPEFGSIECDEGIYEIEFDNAHGKVWSKDIKYSVNVE